METLDARRLSILQAVRLPLLMYGLIVIFSLLALPKAQAAESDEARLLDAMLGRVEYTDSGFFIPVDDITMSLELTQLQAQLDSGEGSAWILDKRTGFAVWGSARVRLKPPVMGDELTPELQTVSDEKYRYVIQNFWLKKEDDSRAYFQMVVAQPLD